MGDHAAPRLKGDPPCGGHVVRWSVGVGGYGPPPAASLLPRPRSRPMQLVVIDGIDPASLAPAVGAQTYAQGCGLRAAARGSPHGVGRRRLRCCRRWCEAAAARLRDERVLRAITGRRGTGVRVRRVHVPGRDQLQARRRRSGHRDGRGRAHRGGRARAAGGVVGAEPGRAACAGPAGLTAIRCRRRSARPRALPLRAAGSRGAAQPGVGEAEAAGPAGAAGSHRVGGRRDDLEQARNLPTTSATAAPRTCGCCGSCTRCTPSRAGAPATTTAATTRRSTSPRSTAGGCGRSWTRPPTSGCSSCTRASGSGRRAVRPGRAVPGRHARARIPARWTSRRCCRSTAVPATIDGDAMPVLFIGAEGHGVVHVSRTQARGTGPRPTGSLRLAKLATPAPPPLQRMVAGGPAPAGARRAAGPVPRRVLPAAAPTRAGHVVRRILHPARRSPGPRWSCGPPTATVTTWR